MMPFWNFREPASTWTHLAGLVLALVALVLLEQRSPANLGKRISLLIYGLGLVACYSASSLFHGVQVPADRLGFYARLDSAGIFALIAASYTPLAGNLMRGPWRAWTLSLVWGTTLASITLLATGRHFSPMIGTCVYLAMGWGFVICYAKISRIIPHRLLISIILGGVSYSVGAVINLLGRPVIWAGIFGSHDLFHLFVIAGSLFHFWFILKVVIPFEWSDLDRHPIPRVGPG